MNMLPENLTKILQHQHYKIVGSHSAVKLCHWTKKSILDEGICYKQKFYGIQCHRCLQMTPAVAWCTQKCIFCWRNIDETIDTKMTSGEIDEPGEIIDKSIKAQRVLLSGYGGIPDRINKKKYAEAQEPNQVAISLSGEPTIYPKISELITEFKKRDFTTFLVTNGTLPKRVAEMELPYQFYLSVDAPTKEIYKKIDNPIISNGWEKINETIDLMPSLDTRKAVRLTMIKGMNMINPEGYAELIKRAEPDYVEVKAYMFVGSSRMRLTLDSMPSFDEVMNFAKKVNEKLNYNLKDWKRDSRVVLLSRD